MLSSYWTGVLLSSVFVTFVKAEDKWVWSKERKSGIVQSDSTRVSVARPFINELDSDSPRRKLDEEISRLLNEADYRKARYEVQEQAEYVNGRPVRTKPLIRDRPLHNRPIPGPLPDRPIPPDGSVNPIHERPDEYLPLSSGIAPSAVRRQPPGQSVGILTGPIPSWEKPLLHKNGDPTNFEHCKCSFSFNCKSPGIQFGSCDQGKQYCCYNEFDGIKGPASPGFGTNIERVDGVPSVLIGPGGPIDDHVKPLIPTPPRGHGYNPYNRPPPPPPLPPRPPYEDIDRLETLEFNRGPHPIISQKPVLPPYMGLHNDHRSS